MSTRLTRFLLLAIVCISAGCANITAPTGGKKDKIPPKLISIDPPDSLKNTRPKRIEMDFDEYITVTDVSKEVEISPLLAVDPAVTGLNKHVIVKIVDTLLDSNTTYRITFGKSIKDLHEGNPFKPYTYTFSTGAYFDSLELRGTVVNAATGLPDTGNVLITLYSASEGDSAVVKHKPKYITRADGNGAFIFKGLPYRRFRIYALGDGNNNRIYDGPAAGDKIAFIDRKVYPGDTTMEPIKLRLFAETPDSTVKKSMDSVSKKQATGTGKLSAGGAGKSNTGKSKQKGSDALSCSVNIDSSNADRRTFNIKKPIDISFNRNVVLHKEKVKLTYDSSGITVTPDIVISIDSQHMHINTDWSQNTVYTLRLAKGFAKDTSEADVMPSRYTFRTFEDEDYGTITLNLPEKYKDPLYVLQVTTDNDTVYQKHITDTTIILTRLNPAKYTFCIIVDKNGNGKWDTGDLFGKLQPEVVIPYREPLTLKAGYDHTIDFEQKLPEQKDNTKR